MRFSTLRGVVVQSSSGKVIGYLSHGGDRFQFKGCTLVDGHMPDHDDLLGSSFDDESALRAALLERMRHVHTHHANHQPGH
jgi:hypothetical protein